MFITSEDVGNEKLIHYPLSFKIEQQYLTYHSFNIEYYMYIHTYKDFVNIVVFIVNK